MKYLILLLFTAVYAVSFGQDTIKARTKDTAAYPVVDVQAQFPGGENEMQKFISHNIKYPPDAVENEISGKVVVSFVVEPNGVLSNITIKKSLGHGCDEEVIRVIKAMPKWKPAEKNGKKVKAMMTLPIYFNLN